MTATEDSKVLASEDADDSSQSIYFVGCVHCGKGILKFSKGFLDAQGTVCMICPVCQEMTAVYSNGVVKGE